VVRGKGRDRIPIVTYTGTHSAPKKILLLGRRSKRVDELNMRGREYEISSSVPFFVSDLPVLPSAPNHKSMSFFSS
jgi:hypothetical protein